MSYSKLSASFLLSLFLVACGGGGSGGGQGATLRGQIVDSPIDGLIYVASKEGEFSEAAGILEQCGDTRPIEDCVTAHEGSFYYQADETVFFFLADLPIGKAPGAAVVTLEDLQAISENDLKSTQMNDPKRGGQINGDSLASQAAVNKAILLQALDGNKDLSDGIQIDFAQLPDDGLDGIDFNMAPDEFVQQVALRSAFPAIDFSAIDIQAAITHMLCSAQDLDNGSSPDGQCEDIDGDNQIDSPYEQNANDQDGDGVVDSSDNCPATYNPEQLNADEADEQENNETLTGNACDADDDGDSISDEDEITAADEDDAVTNPRSKDTDSDGLSDDQEKLKGTDPNKADTDGDGFSDGDEVSSNDDPLSADPDSDNDGLRDSEETGRENGKSAADNDDTDGDGVKDGSDNCPLVANADQATTESGAGAACTTTGGEHDSDGDGIPDVYSVDGSKDNCPGYANTDQIDTDGDEVGNVCDDDDDNDTLPDSEEETFGSNPLDKDSDGDGVDDNVDNCPLHENLDQDDNDKDSSADFINGNNGQQNLSTGGDACDLDDDNDGKSDVDEDEAGTNPFNGDSDDDDVSDGPLDPDGDGPIEVVGNGDNCPLSIGESPSQADTDQDGAGDVCDSDDDGDGLLDAEEADYGTQPLVSDTDADGVADGADNCPAEKNASQADNDSDGFETLNSGTDDERVVPTRKVSGSTAVGGDACDSDNDNDGIDNVEERINGTNEFDEDTDSDGIAEGPDETTSDNCQLDPNADQTDTDGDFQGDACDEDDDNDGLNDSADACPLHYSDDPEHEDHANGCRNAEGELDTDGDGEADATDNCPLISNSGQENNDGDANGDICDDDDDNDGLTDVEEDERGSDPFNGDGDGDGITDGDDNCPTRFNEDQNAAACDPEADADGDGFTNLEDNCPFISNVDQNDFDGDSQGNTCDNDDDNDGTADADDACPGTALDEDADAQGCSAQQRGGDNGGGGLPFGPEQCIEFGSQLDEGMATTFCDALFGSLPTDYDACVEIGQSIDQGSGMAEMFCAGVFPPSESSAPTLLGSCEQGNTDENNQLIGIAPSIAQFAEVDINGTIERAYYQLLMPMDQNGDVDINCSESYPVILEGHGFSGSRKTSGEDGLRKAGYMVVSIDQRGHGQTGGPITVMDPKGEGLLLAAILDEVEKLDYVQRDTDENGNRIENISVGAIGGSYGGGYQFLLLNTDPKQRIDALFADITWHDLRYSLNPGDTIKSLWDLALIGAGEATSQLTGLQNAMDQMGIPNPIMRGLHPFIKETLARGIALNEIPAESLEYFRYHSPSYWCDAAGLPTKPYPARPESPIPVDPNMVLLQQDPTGTLNVHIPEAGEDDGFVLPQAKVFLTQGMPDTLFNFNEAWWNFQCLSANGNEVYLSTHNGGHVLPGIQSPDELSTSNGENSCGTNKTAWFNYVLKGQEESKPDDEVCLSLGEEALELPAEELLAPQMTKDQGEADYSDKSEGYTIADVNAMAIPTSLLGETTVMGALPAPHAVVTLGAGDVDLLLAGIAKAKIRVTDIVGVRGAEDDPVCGGLGGVPTLRTGCDSIIYMGLGKPGVGGPNWVLIDDQLQPVRGLGYHEVELVGVAERLAADEELALLFYGNHIQFFGSTSRDLTIPVVNVTGTIELPLYEVFGEEVTPLAADWTGPGGEPSGPPLSPDALCGYSAELDGFINTLAADTCPDDGGEPSDPPLSPGALCGNSAELDGFINTLAADTCPDDGGEPSGPPLSPDALCGYSAELDGFINTFAADTCPDDGGEPSGPPLSPAALCGYSAELDGFINTFAADTCPEDSGDPTDVGSLIPEACNPTDFPANFSACSAATVTECNTYFSDVDGMCEGYGTFVEQSGLLQEACQFAPSQEAYTTCRDAMIDGCDQTVGMQMGGDVFCDIVRASVGAFPSS